KLFPRRRLGEAFPNRGFSAACEGLSGQSNAAALKRGESTPLLLSIGLPIRSGRQKLQWEELQLAELTSGPNTANPVRSGVMPDTFHPPTILPAAPPTLKCWPGPTGNS